MNSMNNQPDQPTKLQHKHGTTRSYVAGFLLSIILTVVAYGLVVGHSMSGNALVATILGFAMLQMIVQIVFFLHLGREPRPHWNLGFFVATVGLIAVVVGGSMVIMHNLHYNMAPMETSKAIVEDEHIYQIEGAKTGACQELGTNHKVIIKDGFLIPSLTTAKTCDTLTFVNQDDAAWDMAFGMPSQPGSYAGASKLTVYNGRNKRITLTQPGTYQFHDARHTNMRASFTVTPR